jgi:hypothetical protein
MKVHPDGIELFHADGRTDVTKLIVVFYNVRDTPIKFKYSRDVQDMDY